jgi:hypothetical protein
VALSSDLLSGLGVLVVVGPVYRPSEWPGVLSVEARLSGLLSGLVSGSVARSSNLLSGLVSGSVARSSDLLSGLVVDVCWSGHPTYSVAGMLLSLGCPLPVFLLLHRRYCSTAGGCHKLVVSCFAGGPACWRSCLV